MATPLQSVAGVPDDSSDGAKDRRRVTMSRIAGDRGPGMEIAAVSYETRSHIVSLAFSIHLPGRTDAAWAPHRDKGRHAHAVIVGVRVSR